MVIRGAEEPSAFVKRGEEDWQPPQNKNHFRWEWGVSFDWSDKGDPTKFSALPEAREVSRVMAGLQMEAKRKWNGYQLFTRDEDGFERTMESQLMQNECVPRYFSDGLEKFKILRPYLEKLNKAIARGVS